MRRRKHRLTSGSKAQIILDGVFVLVFLMVMAFTGIIISLVYGSFNELWQNETGVSNFSKEIIADQTENFPKVWDSGYLFAVIMLWILLIVTSLFIDTHPVFFILT